MKLNIFLKLIQLREVKECLHLEFSAVNEYQLARCKIGLNIFFSWQANKFIANYWSEKFINSNLLETLFLFDVWPACKLFANRSQIVLINMDAALRNREQQRRNNIHDQIYNNRESNCYYRAFNIYIHKFNVLLRRACHGTTQYPNRQFLYNPTTREIATPSSMYISPYIVILCWLTIVIQKYSKYI